VQAILTDPYINNLLKDMQTNPQAAQRAMSDARVAAQIEKLMVAGACRLSAPPTNLMTHSTPQAF